MDVGMHELALAFPLMGDAEYAELKADIAANGLRQPVVMFDGKVLDGRHRYQACLDAGVEPSVVEFEGDDPVAYVLSANLQRRHLTTGQRAVVAAKLAQATVGAPKGNANAAKEENNRALMPDCMTNDEAAERVKVSPRSVKQAKRVLAEAPAEVVEAMEAGVVAPADAESVLKKGVDESVVSEALGRVKARKCVEKPPVGAKTAPNLSRAVRDVVGEKARKERETRAPSGKFDLRHCSLSELDLADESVDAIITDPPYEREAIPLFGDLRNLAARVLRPGGHLVVMTGSMYLPQWLAHLEGDERLLWRYLMTVRLPGGTTVNRIRKVADGCKPILLYNKVGEHKDGHRQVFNFIESSPKAAQESEHHKWQQSLDVFEHLMERFASPGDVVLDPFLGGGTTGVAALARGCEFIGCDVDGDAVNVAKERLGGVS